MPSVHDTAYPRLKAAVTVRDLAEVYTPTPAEQTLAATLTPSVPSQVGLLIMLKTFQRLGYFVPIQAVPQPIVHHIATHVGTVLSPQELYAYDASGTRRRHMAAIRSHLAIHPYDHATQQRLETVLREAAHTKDDLVDLMNIGIEELIRQRYELPGFTTLRRTAQRVRAEVNRALFQQVPMTLETAGTPIVDQLLQVDASTRQAPWNQLKADPGQPTLTQLRALVTRLHWLTPLNG